MTPNDKIGLIDFLKHSEETYDSKIGIRTKSYSNRLTLLLKRSPNRSGFSDSTGQNPVSKRWILTFPQILLWVQSTKQSLCFLEIETGQNGGYKHKTETHMGIAEPCVISLHSLDITPWKGWKFGVWEHNFLDNTRWTDQINIRQIHKWCFCFYQHGTASLIPEFESLGAPGKSLS